VTELSEAACPRWLHDFDIMGDPEHHRDPYPNYAELRATCPVAHSDEYGGYWIVTRHKDISEVLRDPETFSSRRIRVDDENSGMLPNDVSGPGGLDFGPPLSLTTMDPPLHTSFRQPLLPLFSAALVKSWEPAIRESVMELVDKLERKGSCEFMSEFATELPILVFLDILGVPANDRQVLRHIHEQLSLVPQGLIGPEEASGFQVEELTYYADLIRADEGKGKPKADTIISYLNHTEVDGRPLTLQEKMRLCQQFSRAGLHTTASTLSNMMYFLASHPEERDRLVQRPDLIPAAVDELLRFESIAMPGRLVTRDVEFRGQMLRAGDMVLVPLGSAGRDEAVFDNPDQLRYDRTSVKHLAFGIGRHRCIGMHLARAELRIALEEIHRYLPNYRLMEGRPVVRHTGSVRTTNELWLNV
jgi:cytochrome P450